MKNHSPIPKTFEINIDQEKYSVAHEKPALANAFQNDALKNDQIRLAKQNIPSDS